MFNENCKELDNLPYYYAWNRHCGGSKLEFFARSVGLSATVSQTIWGISLIATVNPVGIAAGVALLAKSYNDYQESWQGREGFIRERIGSNLYTTIDLLLIFRAATKLVRKKSPYGTPKRDLFIKDPINFEPAYKQFSFFESAHLGINSGVIITQEAKNALIIEEAWNEHLDNLEACFE